MSQVYYLEPDIYMNKNDFVENMKTFLQKNTFIPEVLLLWKCLEQRKKTRFFVQRIDLD